MLGRFFLFSGSNKWSHFSTFPFFVISPKSWKPRLMTFLAHFEESRITFWPPNRNSNASKSFALFIIFRSIENSDNHVAWSKVDSWFWCVNLLRLLKYFLRGFYDWVWTHFRTWVPFANFAVFFDRNQWLNLTITNDFVRDVHDFLISLFFARLLYLSISSCTRMRPSIFLNRVEICERVGRILVLGFCSRITFLSALILNQLLFPRPTTSPTNS